MTWILTSYVFFHEVEGLPTEMPEKKKKHINAGDVAMGAVTEAAEVL